MTSRRDFFKTLFGSAAAVAVTPIEEIGKLLLPKEVPLYKEIWKGRSTITYGRLGGKVSSYTELVTETLTNHKHLLADNILDNNALLLKLKQKNRIKN